MTGEKIAVQELDQLDIPVAFYVQHPGLGQDAGARHRQPPQQLRQPVAGPVDGEAARPVEHHEVGVAHEPGGQVEAVRDENRPPRPPMSCQHVTQSA